MSTKPLLKIKNLSVDFNRYQSFFSPSQQPLAVISDLSLEVACGELVAVVGASGSGKSLLAHAILDILPTNARVGGELFFKGKSLSPEAIQQLRGREITLAPQSVSFLNPLMPIGMQLTKGKKNARALNQALALLAKFSLPPETAKMYPHQLSGGMARRVLLATALKDNPELILADEPTPGLDRASATDALLLLRRLADEGKGVLLITHDLELIEGIADKLVVFHSGITVEALSSADFFGGQKIQHPYTQALRSAMDDTAPSAEAIGQAPLSSPYIKGGLSQCCYPATI